MALYLDALTLIRINLNIIASGQKAKAVDIGCFTPVQFEEINNLRVKKQLPLLESPEIVFIGSHLYKSRVVNDGYTIEDVLAQISSVFLAKSSIIHTNNMTCLKSTVRREDSYGNRVLDEAIFEMTQRKPKAELYSVIPKGDYLKVKNKK